MSAKTHPTTIRLTEDDQTFLTSLKIPGATTVSDKVRSLIEDRRLQQEAGRDYKAALTLANNLIDPLHDNIKMAENQHQMHSQLVRRVLEWTPELLATLMTDGFSHREQLPGKAELETLESSLVNHLFRIMDVILQTYVARETALYDIKMLDNNRLMPIQRLFQLANEDNTNNP